MVEQPLPGAMPPLPDGMPLTPVSAGMPLPIDVSAHADTMKFADKIDPFDPTCDRT